jgi:hypothetical protein
MIDFGKEAPSLLLGMVGTAAEQSGFLTAVSARDNCVRYRHLSEPAGPSDSLRRTRLGLVQALGGVGRACCTALYSARRAVLGDTQERPNTHQGRAYHRGLSLGSLHSSSRSPCTMYIVPCMCAQVRSRVHTCTASRAASDVELRGKARVFRATHRLFGGHALRPRSRPCMISGSLSRSR